MSKMSFKQYLNEIFRPGAYRYKRDDPKHPDMVAHTQTKQGRDDFFVYQYTPKDREGNPIKNKTIVTSIMKAGGHPDNHRWDIMFTVGGRMGGTTNSSFPSDVTHRVYDHLTHFVDTYRQKTGMSPMIQYDTTHPKKDRIYQMAAKRLNIKAENATGWVDPDLERSRPRERRRTHDEEPWIDPPHRGVHQRP